MPKFLLPDNFQNNAKFGLFGITKCQLASCYGSRTNAVALGRICDT